MTAYRSLPTGKTGKSMELRQDDDTAIEQFGFN